MIPKEVEILEDCNFVKLSNASLNQYPFAFSALKFLKKLDLRFNQLITIPEEISKLNSLNEIWLEGNKFSEFPKVLSSLPNLQRIWLDKNSISLIPQCNFKKLERLSICYNQLTELGPILFWRSLQVLLLDGNQIENIPPQISVLQNLKKFHICKNKLQLLPDEIGDLPKLEDLSVSENKIRNIPESIGALDCLKKLNFYGNQITSLPPTLAYLTSLQTFNIKKNLIESPPSSFTEDWQTLRGYLYDLLTGQQTCNYVKMVLVSESSFLKFSKSYTFFLKVGDENVGKTTLSRAIKAYCSSLFFPKSNLKKSFNNNPISTDGIEISLQSMDIKVDGNYNLPNNQLYFNIWFSFLFFNSN